MFIPRLVFLLCSLALFANPNALIRQLVDVNYLKTDHPSVLELFEVDKHFFRELSREVFQLMNDFDASLVTEYHPSNWTNPEGKIEQYSLLNLTGRVNDYSSDHNRSVKGKKFRQAPSYPHLAALISSMPHAVNFRINILSPKSRFTQHQEDICFLHSLTSMPALRVRFHLPIATHNQALMLANGNIYHFEEGKIYFFHNGSVHDGVNQSLSAIRVHLLWDMLLTEDTYERMFNRSIPISFLNKSVEIEMDPISIIDIDPNYKKTSYKLSYEAAIESSLCPLQ